MGLIWYCFPLSYTGVDNESGPLFVSVSNGNVKRNIGIYISLETF